MSLRHLALTTSVALALAVAAPAQCVWGSFDGTRINYAVGPLTGTAHVTMRGIITTNGGTIGPATSTLTPAYLATVQVFYTSLLKLSQTLSASEVSALQGWVKAGGHLVVTGDIYSLPFYNQFTQLHNVNFTVAANGCRISVAPSNTTHPVSQGVTKYHYCTNGVFTVGAGGVLLGDDGTANKNPFLAVVDSTAAVKGRLVVTGDHNMFTESFINVEQNKALAANIVKWLCASCNAQASWGQYGTGLAGRNGVPALIPSAPPQHSTTVQLLGSNSAGAATSGLLTVGLQQTNLPLLGGSLLTSLDLLAYLPVPVGGINVPLQVPAFPTACGVDVFFQLLQLDAGAAQGVSFTRGLRLTVGK